MKIIADGDSWFDFPKWTFTGGDVIDHLQALTGWHITNLAHAGDATQEMLSLGQRQRLEAELRGADYLLFSGGGNDIAGKQLVTLLNQRPADGLTTKALSWDRLTAALDMIMAMYDDLAQLRDEVAPQCVIVTHEYDFAIPRDRGVLWFGPWLKPSLEYCGWTAGADQRTIIKLVLHEFALRLRSWKANNHIHVQTQGTLCGSDWHDEMHPNRAGFRKIAMKFADTLDFFTAP